VLLAHPPRKRLAVVHPAHNMRRQQH
jgi:hypothetical protein